MLTSQLAGMFPSSAPAVGPNKTAEAGGKDLPNDPIISHTGHIFSPNSSLLDSSVTQWVCLFFNP